MNRNNETGSIQLRGSFVVAVGNTIVMDVTEVQEHAQYAPKLFASGNDVYHVVHDSSSLQAVETVHVTEQMIDAFVEIMYSSQRASSISEWDQLPSSTEDMYDSLVYLQAKIRAEEGVREGMKAYQKELEDMKSSSRYKNNSPPNCVEIK